MIKIRDFDFNNILLDKQSSKNMSVYKVLYETLIVAKR